MKKSIFALLVLFVSTHIYLAPAQAVDIGAAVTLVATERMEGTPYAETVLLAVPDGNGQHMGLILNRPTEVKLAMGEANAYGVYSDAAPVFFGGPVMTGMLLAAIRAAEPPSPHSIALMPGLFLVTDVETVDSLLKTQSASARFFAGFVVWNRSELEDEIRNGMWETRPADAGVLFRANTNELWPEFARARGLLVLNR